MTWSCFKTLCDAPTDACHKLYKASFSIQKISNTIDFSSLDDSRGKDVYIVAYTCCKGHSYSEPRSNLTAFHIA